MARILLLSDTHNYLDDRIGKYAESCDEIWHAGDVGTLSICRVLQKIKPVRAVYGNIDGQDIRGEYPKDLVFMCEEVKVYMTHIGGYPDRYNVEAKKVILAERPQLFICGHSHILKVMYDKKLNLLHINPGACGMHGFHVMKTMVRFEITGKEIKNLEVIELGRRNEIRDNNSFT
jgi:putative phosphoesterase